MKKNYFDFLSISDSKRVFPGLWYEQLMEFPYDDNNPLENYQTNYWLLFFYDPMGILD